MNIDVHLELVLFMSVPCFVIAVERLCIGVESFVCSCLTTPKLSNEPARTFTISGIKFKVAFRSTLLIKECNGNLLLKEPFGWEIGGSAWSHRSNDI